MPAPRPIADILSQLMARRGYARQMAASSYIEAWTAAVGEKLVKFTRPGQIRRNVLEVIVANSTMMQELTFQKAAILEKLAPLLPDEKIRDLRFKIGPIKTSSDSSQKK